MKKLMLCVLLALMLCACAVAETTPAPDNDAWVQAAADATLRRDPDEDAPVLGSVPKGSELDFLGETPDGDWYHVDWKGDEGWIDADDAKLRWSTFY
ncbi:MAG: SH3 domain-containing protein [Clostridia bacterium]|nr:SH3 domain-containing protein [Clostridia bacterium]